MKRYKVIYKRVEKEKNDIIIINKQDKTRQQKKSLITIIRKKNPSLFYTQENTHPQIAERQSTDNYIDYEQQVCIRLKTRVRKRLNFSFFASFLLPGFEKELLNCVD
jgi:hypothetical protein